MNTIVAIFLIVSFASFMAMFLVKAIHDVFIVYLLTAFTMAVSFSILGVITKTDMYYAYVAYLIIGGGVALLAKHNKEKR